MQAWNQEAREGGEEAGPQEADGQEVWREGPQSAQGIPRRKRNDAVRVGSTISNRASRHAGPFRISLTRASPSPTMDTLELSPESKPFTPGHPSIPPATAGLNRNGGGQDFAWELS